MQYVRDGGIWKNQCRFDEHFNTELCRLTSATTLQKFHFTQVTPTVFLLPRPLTSIEGSGRRKEGLALTRVLSKAFASVAVIREVVAQAEYV
jgi:hypothetical protein